MALRAYGGSDFIRDVTGLALSTAGIGRTRKESDEVLVNDLRKVTRGRPGLNTKKIRRLPGGHGILESARNRGGIHVARTLAGEPPGKQYGARSLTVDRNFWARANEMATWMETHSKASRLKIMGAGFGDVIAAMQDRRITLSDVRAAKRLQMTRRMGERSLSVWANFVREALPFIRGGKFDRGAAERAKRFDLTSATRMHGNLEGVNRRLAVTDLEAILRPRPAQPKPSSNGRY